MRYSLDQLEIFVLATQSGGFSAAARKIGKTQSTVSSAIANLEADWGVQLFDRASRLAVLTPEGQALLSQSKEILERCKVLEGHARSLNQGVETELALTIEVPYSVVMEPLRAFAQQFAHVNVHIQHPHEGNISALVQSGVATLGIGFAQANYPEDLAFTQLGRLVLTHVVCKDHALASRGKLTFAELHAHRRLAFSAHSRGLPTSEYLDASCCWRAESYLALLEMTRSGLGWATLPRQLIAAELARGELVALDLVAYPHTEWQVGVDLVWKKAQALGMAATWLKKRIESQPIFDGANAS